MVKKKSFLEKTTELHCSSPHRITQAGKLILDKQDGNDDYKVGEAAAEFIMSCDNALQCEYMRHCDSAQVINKIICMHIVEVHFL